MADLPSLRALTRELRTINGEIDGPWTVSLCYDADRWEHMSRAESRDGMPSHFGLEDPGYPGAIGGREVLPGDDQPFDAVAAARRILADCREKVRRRG